MHPACKKGRVLDVVLATAYGVRVQLLTTTAAAQRLGIAPQTLRQAVRRGDIKPFIATDAVWLFKVADVDNLAKRRNGTK